MKFDELTQERKSVRSFKNKKVYFGDLMEAVDAAIQGPFAGNLNNMKFIIVEDEKTIEKVAKLANQTWINEAPSLIVVCSDNTHLINQYNERGKEYASQQSGAVIQTILLKLTDLGLGSCWVGSMDYEVVKQILKVPDHIHIEAVIPAGYEKGNAKKSRKHALDTVLRWENWITIKRPTIFKESPMRRA